MKKKILLSIIMLLLVFFTGCGIKKDEEAKKPTSTPTVSEEPKTTTEPTKEPNNIEKYLPNEENVKYGYTGEGNEYASFEVYTDYIEDGRIQTRTENGGTVAVKVMEVKDGQMNLLLSKGECYYRENLLHASEEVEEILLKAPLVKGTEWTLKDNRKRYISNVDVKITTSIGEYTAIEVTTEEKEGVSLDYYAPNIGLVKSIYKVDDMEVTSTLSLLEMDTTYSQVIEIFYPSIQGEQLISLSKEVHFKTNDITRTVLEEAMKDMDQEELQPILTTSSKIKSLFLHKDNVVYIDFNREFMEDMNVGSGYEGMILQCITNTLGKYYGVNEIYLTLENKPYESGHIALEEGERLTVKFE